MNQTQQNASADAPLIEPLLDEKKLAGLLDVAEGTPGNWRRAKPPTGPAFVVVEGQVRYAPADIRQYLSSRRRDPNEQGAA